MTPLPIEPQMPSPSPAGGPDASDPRKRRFPEGFGLAVAAVFGAVLVVATILVGRSLFSGGEENSVETATPSATTQQETTPTSSPVGPDDAPDSESDTDPEAGSSATSTTSPANDVEPVACPAGVEVVICDAASFVQIARGRPFKVFPTVEVLEDTDFDRELLADFDEYRDELAVDGQVLTALGLLQPSDSLVESYRSSLEVGVVGFYDPETERLVVRGNELNLYGQLVLVHELTHAFDDQWFDLDREDFADDDAEYGFLAVVEGNARRVEEGWRAQLDPAAKAQLPEQEFGALSPEDIERFFALPPIVPQLQASPYVDGQVFVDDLVADGGETAADDALVAPPLSSEEVLHPGLDRSTDPELSVEAPPADGEVIDEGRLGELVVRFWLGQVAATGWGGDHYVAWAAGQQSCIRVDLAGDTPTDLDELVAAGERWVDVDPGARTVSEQVSGGVSVVRLTGCA